MITINNYKYAPRRFFLGFLDVIGGLISCLSLGFIGYDLTMKFLFWEAKRKCKKLIRHENNAR